jgi:hypothetical protein
MDLEKGFLGGFLVLGFVIFVVGFLTGMLALVVVSVGRDITSIGVMLFALGFILGMLTIALTMVMIKLSKLQKTD